MLNRLAHHMRMLTKHQRRSLLVASMSTAFIARDLHERRKKYREMQDDQTKTSPVIIYTWVSSHFSTDYTQSESIGHTAISFEGQYVSFWPKTKNLFEIIPGLVIGMRGEFVRDLERDIEIEGRPPSQVLIAEGLDTKAIALHFTTMQKKLAEDRMYFHLLYNYSPRRLFGQSTGHTCTSVVNDLLIAGGLPVKRIHLTPWGTTPLSQLLFYRAIGVKTVQKSITENGVKETSMESQPHAIRTRINN